MTVVACAMMLAMAPLLQTADAEGWSFQAIPYLWTAGLTGRIGPDEIAPTVDLDFDDILEVTEVGFVGSFEADYNGEWFFIAEGMYLELEESGPTPAGAKATLNFDYGLISFVGGRSVTDGIDVYVGGRYIDVGADISVSGGPGTDKSESWADPIVGFRATGTINDRTTVKLAMDVGGFGVNSDITYALATNVEYEFNDTLSGIFGYRILDVEYEKSGFVYDAKQDGLLLGLGISF